MPVEASVVEVVATSLRRGTLSGFRCPDFSLSRCIRVPLQLVRDAAAAAQLPGLASAVACSMTSIAAAVYRVCVFWKCVIAASSAKKNIRLWTGSLSP